MRTFADEVSATFSRVFAYLGAMAVLAVLCARIFGTPAVEAAVEPGPRPEWATIDRPYRSFQLNLPEFAEADGDYAIQRHTAAGGRKDVMTWGSPDGNGSRLMLEIYRPGQELQNFSDPPTKIAGLANELGAASDFHAVDAIDSKFGRFDLVEFAATAGERRRNCLGFARTFDEPRMQIAGWYCKANAEVVQRTTVACAIERLTLRAAASDQKLQELFSQAELKRTFCGQNASKGPLTALRRNDWIAAPKGPKLRGRFVAR